jgi:hypothetical protein
MKYSSFQMLDLLSLDDCEPNVKEAVPLVKSASIAWALRCLISYYRPCLNKEDNPIVLPLLERYKR